MALIESLPLELGTRMPDFSLQDPYGDVHTTMGLLGEKGLLVVFTCNHCPYALAVWDRLNRLAKMAHGLGIHTVAINPNIHPDYPEDSPDKMGELIVKRHIMFPYLIDDTQMVAKAYRAQCTPDIYLLNAKTSLVYHGRIDDNWQDETSVKSQDLKVALLALGNKQTIPRVQYPSMGCSIKWREK
jgi:peroxiredoxin